MRRVLFFASCAVLFWLATVPAPKLEAQADDPAFEREFEERVLALAESRRVVGQEALAALRRLQAGAEDAKDGVQDLYERARDIVR